MALCWGPSGKGVLITFMEWVYELVVFIYLFVVFCFILPFKVDLSAFDLIVAACSLKNVHWVALVGLSHDIFKRFHYFDHHGQIFHVKERVIDIYDPLGPLMFRDFEATFAALWT
jgi:hypothetical protein